MGTPIRKRPHGRRIDERFALHQCQPRADKLNARQREICRADPAFLEALKSRVGSPERFAAFLAGSPFYIEWEDSCKRCGDYKRRVRDRSCYGCHLKRGRENFERMKAGVAPEAGRSQASHLDLLERRRRERSGECIEKQFDGLLARRWPTGRLEIIYPDGERDEDINQRTPREILNAISHVPQLRQVLIWAGWTAWPEE